MNVPNVGGLIAAARRGFKSSEFALAAAAMALPVVDHAVENLTAHAPTPNADGDARSWLVSIGAAAVAGAYAVGRSWVKTKALQAAAAHLDATAPGAAGASTSASSPASNGATPAAVVAVAAAAPGL